MRKKRKLNISKIVVFIIVVIILVLGVFFILNKSKENKSPRSKKRSRFGKAFNNFSYPP